MKRQASKEHDSVVAVVGAVHLVQEEVGIDYLVHLQWSQPAAIAGPVLVSISPPQLGLGRSSSLPTRAAFAVSIDLWAQPGLLAGYRRLSVEAAVSVMVVVRAPVVCVLAPPSLLLFVLILLRQATWLAQAIAVDSLGTGELGFGNRGRQSLKKRGFERFSPS